MCVVCESDARTRTHSTPCTNRFELGLISHAVLWGAMRSRVAFMQWSAPQSSSHHCAGQHRLHNLATLVRGHVAQTNDRVARPRAREAHTKNLRLNREHVAGSHRI